MIQKNQPPTILLLMLLGFYLMTMITIVESSPSSEDVSAGVESLSISSRSSSEETSSSKEGPLLKFLLRPVNDNSNSDNNAVPANQKEGELYLRHKDNDDGNNDSNVSLESEDDDSGKGLRLRRAEPAPASATGGSKVIATNWGTYEEQAPVVVHSESRTFDTDSDDEPPTYFDLYKSREGGHEIPNDYGGPVGSISYEDYEAGHFEGRAEQGRQFYPSRGGADGGYENSGEEQEQEQPDGYYRQKYYATTPKPKQDASQPDDSEEDSEKRPYHPNRGGPQRPQYRHPQQQQQQQDTSANGLMGFFQKAKTFYDIYKAMNSAWKTVEEHYRKTGEGIFPEDLKKMNESTRIALANPNASPSTNTNSKQSNTKKPKTITAPINPTEEEEEQQDTIQERQNNEYRSRRASAEDELVNEDETSASSHLTAPESSPYEEENSQSSESDLASDSSSDSTAVAEGRYIKGDPLKGYYDFVITEGSYKFWAVFQVGTAILIIYSTFAAIYYSKVNPLVSDYDYIDYLGGGRSLSDDSDFVDTDAPSGGSKGPGTSAPRGAVTKSRQQPSAGWFDWIPHAGHTLRFILESIDKGYNNEE